MKWSKFSQSRSKDTFLPGDWNVLDDLTGMKVKASQTSFQWDGFQSTKSQKRHEQDSLRARKERIKTPWARPEADDVFGQTSASDL